MLTPRTTHSKNFRESFLDTCLEVADICLNWSKFLEEVAEKIYEEKEWLLRS
jgi:hypothetical protein